MRASAAASAKRNGVQRSRAIQAKHPELAADFERRMLGDLPRHGASLSQGYLAQTAQATGALATRQSSQQALNAFGPSLPELYGGSADLTGSNNTNRKDSRVVTGADASGNYLHYGVREFGMAAMMNGIALHGGFIPYGGTFLVFSDYARNAMRMSALMKQRVIYVHDARFDRPRRGWSHASAHRASASLRMIPNMTVWRPCDGAETAVAWAAAIERPDGPTCLALTRQGIPAQPRSAQIARRDPSRRVCAEGLRGRAGDHADGDWLGSRAGGGRGSGPAPTRSPRARSVDAVHQRVR